MQTKEKLLDNQKTISDRIQEENHNWDIEKREIKDDFLILGKKVKDLKKIGNLFKGLSNPLLFLIYLPYALISTTLNLVSIILGAVSKAFYCISFFQIDYWRHKIINKYLHSKLEKINKNLKLSSENNNMKGDIRLDLSSSNPSNEKQNTKNKINSFKYKKNNVSLRKLGTKTIVDNIPSNENTLKKEDTLKKDNMNNKDDLVL